MNAILMTKADDRAAEGVVSTQEIDLAPLTMDELALVGGGESMVNIG